MRDQIIPTAIVREGEDDGLEEKRAQLIAAGRLQTPRSFLAPRTHAGFSIRYPDQGASLPVWRDARGQAVDGSVVAADRAEIGWTGEKAVPGVYSLTAADGRRLAEVSVHEDGSSRVLTESGASGWYWVGVERHAEDDAQLTAAQWSERLQWRLLNKRELPASWRRNDQWLDGRGFRLDMPVEDGRGETAYPLALVDQWTGKALVHEHQRQVSRAPTIPPPPT